MKLRTLFARPSRAQTRASLVAPAPTVLLLENFVVHERDWEAFFALVEDYTPTYRYTCSEEETSSGERDFIFQRFEAEGMSDKLALLSLKLAVFLRWS